MPRGVKGRQADRLFGRFQAWPSISSFNGVMHKSRPARAVTPFTAVVDRWTLSESVQFIMTDNVQQSWSTYHCFDQEESFKQVRPTSYCLCSGPGPRQHDDKRSNITHKALPPKE